MSVPEGRMKGNCMSGQLSGRVALVSGGGRGIGRGICELLASQGAAVAVNYRKDKESALETVDAIIAAGGHARAYEASVDSPEAVAIMVDQVVADFGYVDILVCNAGIASRGQAVADTDPNEVIRLLNTHAIGPHHLSRCVLPSMRTRDRGDIVMISSVATSHMTANGGPYSMGRDTKQHLLQAFKQLTTIHSLANCQVDSFEDLSDKKDFRPTGDRSCLELVEFLQLFRREWFGHLRASWLRSSNNRGNRHPW